MPLVLPNKSLERARRSAQPRKGVSPIRHIHIISLVAVVVGQVSGCASSKTADQSIFAVPPGIWGWEQSEELGCGGNSHTLSFTKDRAVMLLKHEEASIAQGIPAEAVRYRVLQSEPGLRMAIEGESRMTPAGEPVVWDVVMLSADRFCWRRTDWSPESCTPAVVRCPVNR